MLSSKNTSRLKLAGTYLAIIMGMSLIFSFTIYSISDRELRGQRQVPFPQNQRPAFIDEFDRLRERQLELSRENLRERLFVFNLVTLLFGGLLSYMLALRALHPIEEAMDAQNRFTSDASHEIRTPLTAMRSEIEVTLRDKKLSVKDARQTLASNLEEIIKLEALTSGLLQLAKHENTNADFEDINLSKLVKNAADQVQPLAKNKEISTETKPLPKNAVVAGEPNSLQQALVILLDNAIKYSPERGKIIVTLNSNRTSHTITVSDAGPGIDKEDLPYIFDRFYRSDKSRAKTSQTDGYGLGLAIAKRIVDSHGGDIEINNKKPTGVVARLILPKKK